MIGIYLIKNGNYAYVGLSYNIENRLLSHRRLIEKGIHPNFVGFSNNIQDYSYEICCVCEKEDLFIKEKEFFDKHSQNYTMLNKRNCGEGGFKENVEITDGSKIALSINESNVSIGSNLINHIEFKGKKLYDATMMLDLVVCFLGSEKRMSSILSDKGNIEKIECLYKIRTSEESLIKSLKKNGLYKAIGARQNKKVYVALEILLLIYSECHPFCYSEYICYITKKILLPSTQ